MFRLKEHCCHHIFQNGASVISEFQINLLAHCWLLCWQDSSWIASFKAQYLFQAHFQRSLFGQVYTTRLLGSSRRQRRFSSWLVSPILVRISWFYPKVVYMIALAWVTMACSSKGLIETSLGIPLHLSTLLLFIIGILSTSLILVY